MRNKKAGTDLLSRHNMSAYTFTVHDTCFVSLVCGEWKGCAHYKTVSQIFKTISIISLLLSSNLARARVGSRIEHFAKLRRQVVLLRFLRARLVKLEETRLNCGQIMNATPKSLTLTKTELVLKKKRFIDCGFFPEGSPAYKRFSGVGLRIIISVSGLLNMR